VSASELFVGLDVSTQGCKLVVLDLSAEALVHTDRVDYDRDLPAFGTRNGVVPATEEGVSESDPLMWTEAVETLLHRLRETDLRRDAVRCISVSGQQHGLVALDGDGRMARPRSKLWNDFSTAEECRILTEAVGGDPAMIQEVGNTQRTGYTAAKILHLRRHEPEAFGRTRIFFLVHNFVNWHLTGGPDGGVAEMEPGDLSGMALWHPGTGRWSRKVLEAIDPGLSAKLPPVHRSDRTLGSLSPALARRFGLPEDCRIDAGSGDNMYGAVGTGNIQEGVVTVSLGTSGTAYTFLREAFIDPAGEIAAFCDSTGHHLPLVCVSNMANGYTGLREELGLSHAEFDKLFFQSPPGNRGRVTVPWYEGERTPELPHAAALSFGFGPGESHGPSLCRAMVEGHVLNLFDGFTRLPVTPREVRVTGGLSNSPAWCQAIADVFGAEAVPVKGEGAALGAAIHAAWVWCRESGRVTPLDELCRIFVQLDEGARRKPDPSNRATYLLLHRLYRSLSRRIRGMDGEDPFLLRREIMALYPDPPAHGPGGSSGEDI